MKKNVRLIDIGRELGVSAVTVSNALSNQKGVSDELREKIVKKAEEMGYANPQANSRKEKAINIGVIISNFYLDKYASFYWDAYQRMSIKAMESNCVTIVEIIKAEDIKEKTVPLIVRDDKVQALIILGEVDTAYLENLRDNIDIPIVFADFYKKDMTDINAVISNNFYGEYLLTDEVIKRGHRDLMFVGTPNSTASITDRYFGFVKAVMENGIDFSPEMIVRDRDEENTHVEIRLPSHMPSAFVCNCDLTAAEITQQLTERGVRVPEDVSVVGFDNYLYPGLSDIQFTTYDVNVDALVRRALLIVTRLVNKSHETEPRTHIISGKIVEGESLAEKH